jgi:hypothetical protein
MRTRKQTGNAMELYDQRLGFARDLVFHWSDVCRRNHVLVPSERNLDFPALGRILPNLSIMDSLAPDASIIVYMGRDRTEPDLAPEIKRANWFELIPQEARDLAEHAREKLGEIPCGVYYHYAVSGADDFFQEGETLVLPLCKGNSKTPSSSISVRNVLRKQGKVDSSHPLKLEKLQLEYVDIGAGIPQE